MIRKIVSSRLEESCIYLQCDCGNEIIKLYYYLPTTTCQEIILLDYIGNIVDKKLFRYKYIDMSSSMLTNLVNALQRCEKTGPFTHELTWVDRELVLKKEISGVTKIELYYLKPITKNKRKKQLVWDIHVRDEALIEFNKLVDEMKTKLEEVTNNATRNHQ